MFPPIKVYLGFRLDESRMELHEISVGSNIIMHQIKIFPGENLIFIPTHQFVGAY